MVATTGTKELATVCDSLLAGCHQRDSGGVATYSVESGGRDKFTRRTRCPRGVVDGEFFAPGGCVTDALYCGIACPVGMTIYSSIGRRTEHSRRLC